MYDSFLREPGLNFWGLKVPPGEPVDVNLKDKGKGSVLHLSLACLREYEEGKGNERVLLHAHVGGVQHLIGILWADKWPQLSLDLAFEKEFKLSHTCKYEDVHFAGYILEGDSREETDSPGKAKDEPEKSAAAEGKTAYSKTNAKKVKREELPSEDYADGKTAENMKKVKKAKPIKTGTENEVYEDESEDEDGNDSDKDLTTAPLGAAESDEIDTDDEMEDPPKKAKRGKKRSAEAPTKTPAPGKKAKLVSPLNIVFPADAKKSNVHVATPFPSKQAGKLADDKPKKKTPKSGGDSKPLGSEQAPDSRTMAKHGK